MKQAYIEAMFPDLKGGGHATGRDADAAAHLVSLSLAPLVTC